MIRPLIIDKCNFSEEKEKEEKQELKEELLEKMDM
jgi:hypothetical protein